MIWIEKMKSDYSNYLFTLIRAGMTEEVNDTYPACPMSKVTDCKLEDLCDNLVYFLNALMFFTIFLGLAPNIFNDKEHIVSESSTL